MSGIARASAVRRRRKLFSGLAAFLIGMQVYSSGFEIREPAVSPAYASIDPMTIYNGVQVVAGIASLFAGSGNADSAVLSGIWQQMIEAHRRLDGIEDMLAETLRGIEGLPAEIAILIAQGHEANRGHEIVGTYQTARQRLAIYSGQDWEEVALQGFLNDLQVNRNTALSLDLVTSVSQAVIAFAGERILLDELEGHAAKPDRKHSYAATRGQMLEVLGRHFKRALDPQDPTSLAAVAAVIEAGLRESDGKIARLMGVDSDTLPEGAVGWYSHGLQKNQKVDATCSRHFDPMIMLNSPPVLPNAPILLDASWDGDAGVDVDLIRGWLEEYSCKIDGVVDVHTRVVNRKLVRAPIPGDHGHFLLDLATESSIVQGVKSKTPHFNTDEEFEKSQLPLNAPLEAAIETRNKRVSALLHVEALMDLVRKAEEVRRADDVEAARALAEEVIDTPIDAAGALFDVRRAERQEELSPVLSGVERTRESAWRNIEASRARIEEAQRRAAADARLQQFLGTLRLIAQSFEFYARIEAELSTGAGEVIAANEPDGGAIESAAEPESGDNASETVNPSEEQSAAGAIEDRTITDRSTILEVEKIIEETPPANLLRELPGDRLTSQEERLLYGLSMLNSLEDTEGDLAADRLQDADPGEVMGDAIGTAILAGPEEGLAELALPILTPSATADGTILGRSHRHKLRGDLNGLLGQYIDRRFFDDPIALPYALPGESAEPAEEAIIKPAG